MTERELLEEAIVSAWEEFSEIAREEEADDYGDAMVSMERTEAQGYAEGLEAAYLIIFHEPYIVKEII